MVLPDIVFDEGQFNLHLGGKTIQLLHLPGHSNDLIGAFVLNDRILFASDTAMPVPTLFDGNYDDLVASMHTMLDLSPESVVQGHGDVILRGEVKSLIESDLEYLKTIKTKVIKLIKAGKPASALAGISIESCGKSRIPLNGFVTDLHHANLVKLYHEWSANGAASSLA